MTRSAAQPSRRPRPAAWIIWALWPAASTARWPGPCCARRRLPLLAPGELRAGHAPWAPCATAALLNGITGHTLELDDGDRRSYGHPGVVVLSALFPVAEALRASGKDFLLAMTIGYEAYVRIGQAANPGMLRRGYHSTGTAGALAAALAVSSVRGFDTDAMLGPWASPASAPRGCASRCARPANSSPSAPAARPITALSPRRWSPWALRGPMTSWKARTVSSRPIPARKPIPPCCWPSRLPPFAVEGSYIKFYPACRYTHAPIDAALALRDKVVLDDVEKIIITTYPTAISLTAKDTLPADAASTRFNMGFGVALALAQGKVSMSDFCAERRRIPRSRPCSARSGTRKTPRWIR